MYPYFRHQTTTIYKSIPYIYLFSNLILSLRFVPHKYLISANYMGQEGVVIENDNKRYQGRANITSQITDWLHVTADVNASHNVRHSGNFAAGKDNIVNVAVNYAPVLSIMKEDGTYMRDQYSAITQNNPVGTLKEQIGETMTALVGTH